MHYNLVRLRISFAFPSSCVVTLGIGECCETIVDYVAVLIRGVLENQAGKFVKELGQIMGVQVLIEAPMNSSSPYFSSSWRREANFKVPYLCPMQHFVSQIMSI